MRLRTFLRPLCVLSALALQIQLAAADAAPTFSPRQLREDLAALKASIDRIHPASTHSVSDAALTSALASVSKQLDRPMTPDEAWRVMSTLNPIMADGHMVVSPPENPAAAIARHLRAGGRLGSQTLIIDIRANTGGDDDMWLEGIMPYIATKPFRNGSDYVSKVVEGRQQEGQKIGEVIRGSQSNWYQPSLDDPLRFTGKVYVLIGPATYSSSILFTTAVQDYGFATVAGTGGAARASQTGGTQRTTLPHTKIGVVMPRFVLKRASREEGLVQPDVLISEDPFTPGTAIESLLRDNGRNDSRRSVEVGRGSDWEMATVDAKNVPAGVQDLFVTQVGSAAIEVDWMSFR